MQASAKQTDRRDNSKLIAQLERQVEGVIFTSMSENLKALVHEAVHEGLVKVVSDTKPTTAKPRTGETIREERNGVVKPGKPGKCLQVWEELDKMVARKKTPTLAMIQEVAAKKGWNVSNARVEFYRWKKFHAWQKGC